jgi:hypothetical protein
MAGITAPAIASFIEELRSAYDLSYVSSLLYRLWLAAYVLPFLFCANPQAIDGERRSERGSRHYLGRQRTLR